MFAASRDRRSSHRARQVPKNGPETVEAESSYSFEYGNALFIMIDATSEVGDHMKWLEEKLSTTKATWKFVMFHFPPYNFEEPYPDIQEAWVPLFDKYHVDMVMGGHIHYYMRSNPMFKGKVVDDFAKGQAKGSFVEAGVSDIAGDLDGDRAARAAHAEILVERTALVEDDRHRSQRDHVIDDCRLTEQPLMCGQRWLGADEAALALKRFEQRGQDCL
jgi:hypothetical protein